MKPYSITAVIVFLGLSACTGMPEAHMPRPVPGSENIRVLMKTSPGSGCTATDQIKGVARGTSSKEAIWEAALTDARNKAFNLGANVVVVNTYGAKREGQFLEIFVSGMAFRCSVRRPASRKPHRRRLRRKVAHGTAHHRNAIQDKSPESDTGFGVRPPAPAAPPIVPQPIQQDDGSEQDDGSAQPAPPPPEPFYD